MTNQSEGVRAEVTFKTARRAMAHARKKSIPTGPSTIEEVIGGLEAGTYPPLYQGMYVGSVHNDTTGNLFRYNIALLKIIISFPCQFHLSYKATYITMFTYCFSSRQIGPKPCYRPGQSTDR